MIARPMAEYTNKAAPLKRSLFNKPSWSSAKSIGSSSLFNRSDQTYVGLAAEAERQQQRKLTQKELERARLETGDERASKRRRISDDEDDDDHSNSDESSNQCTVEKPTITSDQPKTAITVPSPSSVKSKTSLIRSYEETVAAGNLKQKQKRTAPLSSIIDLEDDEDPPDETEKSTDHEALVIKPRKAYPEDEIAASDEEFPELARQAREKARRKQLEQDIASQTPENLQSAGQESFSARSQSLHHSTPPPWPDPVLNILITSSIPDTQPLIVTRKLTQRLKDVRLAWVERQRFTPGFADMVFLTWRGKRLFDVTSCKSLGIIVDVNGNVSTKGDILGNEKGQIHMEAMTAEILEAYKKTKSRDPANDDEQASAEEQDFVEKKKEPQVRIILKSKGFADFKLIVKPTTFISRIVNAFRTANEVDLNKEVFLSFDGERLELQSKVEDTELADMDFLDVYVR